jgi:hypothetical protein
MLSPAFELISVGVLSITGVALVLCPVPNIQIDPDLESVAIGKVGGNTASSPWV